MGTSNGPRRRAAPAGGGRSTHRAVGRATGMTMYQANPARLLRFETLVERSELAVPGPFVAGPVEASAAALVDELTVAPDLPVPGVLVARSMILHALQTQRRLRRAQPFIEREGHAPAAGPGPIVIAGAPRTGTTLLQQPDQRHGARPQPHLLAGPAPDRAARGPARPRRVRGAARDRRRRVSRSTSCGWSKRSSPGAPSIRTAWPSARRCSAPRSTRSRSSPCSTSRCSGSGCSRARTRPRWASSRSNSPRSTGRATNRGCSSRCRSQLDYDAVVSALSPRAVIHVRRPGGRGVRLVRRARDRDPRAHVRAGRRVGRCA